jgi:hypothetical protein
VVGLFVGDSVGLFVGDIVGLFVGDFVGKLLGDLVGDFVGDSVGIFVGRGLRERLRENDVLIVSYNMKQVCVDNVSQIKTHLQQFLPFWRAE